ncbi:MAG: hypothetical protein K9M17_05105 [Mariprofundaceae bacterium]|nr:hypothetical protein [Mariprofundaceae bacterium]
MKFFFTIDALSAAGDKAWRLQQDRKSWRPCTYAETASEADARIFETSESEGWTGRRLKADKEHGLIIKEKPGTFDFLVRGIYSHAVLHRQSAAPLPGKVQMIDTITSLAPGTPWLVYLNVAGQFKAIDTNSSRIIGNLDIAVRGEIASSENYIGPKAIENEQMMNELYHQFIAGWDEHLQTSQMAVFIPDTEKLKEESFYIEHIQNWQPENQ